ncbi:MAG TPA: hypothetical protein DEA08_09210 [Planctomycetes bacterium]|nr:hypothetical protein [Planctomycetota bacterium]
MRILLFLIVLSPAAVAAGVTRDVTEYVPGCVRVQLTSDSQLPLEINSLRVRAVENIARESLGEHGKSGPLRLGQSVVYTVFAADAKSTYAFEVTYRLQDGATKRFTIRIARKDGRATNGQKALPKTPSLLGIRNPAVALRRNPSRPRPASPLPRTFLAPRVQREAAWYVSAEVQVTQFVEEWVKAPPPKRTGDKGTVTLYLPNELRRIKKTQLLRTPWFRCFWPIGKRGLDQAILRAFRIEAPAWKVTRVLVSHGPQLVPRDQQVKLPGRLRDSLTRTARSLKDGGSGGICHQGIKRDGASFKQVYFAASQDLKTHKGSNRTRNPIVLQIFHKQERFAGFWNQKVAIKNTSGLDIKVKSMFVEWRASAGSPLNRAELHPGTIRSGETWNDFGGRSAGDGKVRMVLVRFSDVILEVNGAPVFASSYTLSHGKHGG